MMVAIISPAHSPLFASAAASSTSRSPLCSPRGAPPPPPPGATSEKVPSPPRNHRRTNNSTRAIEQHKASVLRAPVAVAETRPQRPAKPVRLATPTSGYPFPVMATTPQDEVFPTLEPYRDVERSSDVPERKGKPEGDGWDTPASSLSRASSIASNRLSGAPSRLAPMPGLTSAFSDCSSSASSSPCSTPHDSSAASSASSRFAFDSDRKAMPSPLGPPLTPAEITYSRLKHAGSTPGAPPPAPLVKTQAPVGQQVFDLQDIRANSAPSYGPSSSPRAGSPARKDRPSNPLSGGMTGLSLSSSSHSQREQAPGVGSKWEVD